MEKVNTFKLSRQWFDFAFDNTDIISGNHAALYFFAIDHNNRLGWKSNFGFPTGMAMEAIGLSSYRTFKKCLDDLIKWDFIKLIKDSSNQYSSRVISLTKANIPESKSLSSALSIYGTKPQKDDDTNNLKEQVKKARNFKIDDDKTGGEFTNGTGLQNDKPPAIIKTNDADLSTVGSEYATEQVTEMSKLSGVIDLLNESADLQYSFDYPTSKLMVALVVEGYTAEQMNEVVLLKVANTKQKIKGQPVFRRDWLAPSTLFKKTKFPKYANQVRDIKNGNSQDAGVSFTGGLEALSQQLQVMGLPNNSKGT